MSDQSIEQVKADLVLLSTVDLPRVIALGTELATALGKCRSTTELVTAGTSNPLLEQLVDQLREAYLSHVDGMREVDKAVRTAEETLGTL